VRREIPLIFIWGDLEKTVPHALDVFEKVGDLKHNLLLRCKRCGRHWILCLEENAVAWVLDEKALASMQNWASRHLKPSADVWKVLESIGQARVVQQADDRKRLSDERTAVFEKIAARFGLTKDRLAAFDPQALREIPCRAVHKNGTVYECALLILGTPTPQMPRDILFLDDIASLSPSAFAFPLAVREKALHAEEIAMGSAPMMLEDATGQRHVTDALVLFGRAGDQPGSNMRFVSATFNELRQPRSTGFEPMNPVWVLGEHPSLTRSL